MRLLIITQSVDRHDPILGFFRRWIDTFAVHCSHVTVISQQVGTYHAPHNVTVFSLGKEQGASRLQQVVLFWRHILGKHKHYDTVFVHMTPIWVILGFPVWFILRKKIYLWYEIKRGSFKLSLALRLVEKVFAATEHGIPGTSKKLVVTGHGIDVDAFHPGRSEREEGLMVTVGRITRIKNLDSILTALSQLPEHIHLTIAGGPVTVVDKEEERRLHEMIFRLHLKDRVTIGWVAPDDVPLLLSRASVFVHASQGGLDKVVLQAMACGCLVVSTSQAAFTQLPEPCRATTETLSQKVEEILHLPEEERQKLTLSLRERVTTYHALEGLIETLVQEMR